MNERTERASMYEHSPAKFSHALISVRALVVNGPAARLESSESLEFVAEISKDRTPDETTTLLGETSNLVAAAAAMAALWRTNEIRAAEVLMQLSTPRGAELLRIMIVSLNDTEAATALVALEEPGRVVGRYRLTLSNLRVESKWN